MAFIQFLSLSAAWPKEQRENESFEDEDDQMKWECQRKAEIHERHDQRPEASDSTDMIRSRERQC